MVSSNEIESLIREKDVGSIESIPVSNSREFIAVFLKQAIGAYGAAAADNIAGTKDFTNSFKQILKDELDNNMKNVHAKFPNDPKLVESIKKTHDIFLSELDNFAAAMEKDITRAVDKEFKRVLWKKGELSQNEKDIQEFYAEYGEQDTKFRVFQTIANDTVYMQTCYDLLKKDPKEVTKDIPSASYRLKAADFFESIGCEKIAGRIRDLFYKSQIQKNLKKEKALIPALKLKTLKKALIASHTDLVSNLTPVVNSAHKAKRANMGVN